MTDPERWARHQRDNAPRKHPRRPMNRPWRTNDRSNPCRVCGQPWAFGFDHSECQEEA